MNKIFCLSFTVALAFGLPACQSKKPQPLKTESSVLNLDEDLPQEESEAKPAAPPSADAKAPAPIPAPVPTTAAVPAPAPPASLPEIKACAKYGSPTNFNDQRIVGFQKTIGVEILKIKSKSMTQDSTQELAMLETLRRRVSAPLLTPTLRPQTVSKIIVREAKNLIAILELLRKNDPLMTSVIQETDYLFIKQIENQDQWNCIEKQIDFVEDPIERIQ